MADIQNTINYFVSHAEASNTATAVKIEEHAAVLYDLHTNLLDIVVERNRYQAVLEKLIEERKQIVELIPFKHSVGIDLITDLPTALESFIKELKELKEEKDD